MTKAVAGLRSVLVGGMVLGLTTVAGCGGDEGSSGSAAATSSTSATIDRGSSTSSTNSPSLAGSPPTTAMAGEAYSFQPKVANASGTVKFTVKNLPSWAKFDAATGQLTGTPNSSNIGTFSGISIAATASGSALTLPDFAITVAPSVSQANAVTVSWQPPMENTDGTSLSDLKGYRVKYGPSPKAYSSTIQVTNPGLTMYVVDNLPSGHYYFAVTAYNNNGYESAVSGELQTQVN
jgi:hypothetical protein